MLRGHQLLHIRCWVATGERDSAWHLVGPCGKLEAGPAGPWSNPAGLLVVLSVFLQLSAIVHSLSCLTFVHRRNRCVLIEKVIDSEHFILFFLECPENKTEVFV